MTETNTEVDVTTRIRGVLQAHGRLARDPLSLDPDDDLYEVGLTSHASVNVMLALEGEFDIEFPDHLLSRKVFSSISSIQQAIESLLA